MADNHHNIPMTKEEADAFDAQDDAWTGPKLIALCTVVLGSALVLLYLLSINAIGPTIHQ